jgi:putative Mg2+ transporter-C (MgtC) family protein
VSPVLDDIGRLVRATAVGLALGFNRNLAGKQMGMRTLALVSLGAAVITMAATSFFSNLAQFPDALGRVVQGVVQGVLIGIGFIGAGAILRDREQHTVHGLTTAATVWVTAALGVACDLAAWPVGLIGAVIALAILFIFRWREQRWHIAD